MADAISDIGGAIGGPLVGGGLSLLGGLFQQQGANQSIQSQEAFQERMSSSAYQRAVADMKSAGLNPALMYGSGGPESSPSGASMMPPNITQGVASSAMDALRLQGDLKEQESRVNLNKVNQALLLTQVPFKSLEGDFWKAVTPAAQAVGKIINDLSTDASKGFPKATAGVGKLLKQGQATAKEGFDPLGVNTPDRSNPTKNYEGDALYNLLNGGLK